MCVAQGVNPGTLSFPSFLPPRSAAEGGGTWRQEGPSSCPRADALGYTHVVPPGTFRGFSYPELTLFIIEHDDIRQPDAFPFSRIHFCALISLVAGSIAIRAHVEVDGFEGMIVFFEGFCQFIESLLCFE